MGREHQPSLLWAHAVSYLQAQHPEREIGPTDLTVYVYRTDQSGAYMMHGPKLYWADEPMSGQYFINCSQSALEEDAEHLGEVVLWDRRYKRTEVVGRTYAEAWKKLTNA